MDLKSRNVFIDTQSFVKMGMNFNHPALESFTELCKKKQLFHLSTSIVKREVEYFIRQSIQEALTSLQKFRRKARLLEKIDDKNIGFFFKDIDEEEVQTKATDIFESFLSESNCKILNLKSIDSEEIFDLYFLKKAPFGVGKKKSEFPDAFSIQSLIEEVGKEKVYVISEDKDLVSACETNDCLISVETLDKFLDLYNEHESAITDLVKTYLLSIEDTVKTRIGDEIRGSWGINEAPWEDSEVDEYEIIEINDITPTVVWVNEEECLITFDVDVDLEFTISGPDFNNGIYDKEDGKIYTFGSTSHSSWTTNTYTVEIGFSYEIQNEKLVDIEETEFYIPDLSDGVAFYMEEAGDDWRK